MANAKLKLGVLLPTRGLLLRGQPPTDADLVLNLARQVETAGLESVWVGDSLTAKPRLEPLASLAAVAAVTQRVRLGTAVLLGALRHPVLLAQTMATVDVISRGRLVIAAGVGGAFNDEQRGEWQAAGVDPTRRARRLEELVQVVKQLGAGNPVTFSGSHFQLDGVTLEPKPVQPGGVPILLACHWRAKERQAQFKRAARFSDGIISISDTPAEYSQVLQEVRTMAAELGRDAGQLETVFYLTVNVDDDVAKAEVEAGKFLMRYYGANIWGTRWGPFGGPQRVADRIAEYAPNAKIIYSMRHPVARMESHYTQELAKGWRDDGSKIPTGKYGDLLETSMYAKQLQPYRDSFPEENILLLRFEEMISEPAATLQRVCLFLGIDPSYTFQSLDKAHSSNAGRRPGELGYYIYRFRQYVPFWTQVTARLPARYANAVRRLFQRKGVRNSTFSHARQQAILAELQDDLRRLHNDFAFDVEPWGIMCPDRDRMGGPPEDAHARPSTAS